jgi:PIN domain nuclease of toxin-antitoxin system
MLSQHFSKDNTVVVTQLRDPIQRVISAYEFSIEVAGRKIQLSDKEFLKQKANTSAVNTFNVWPWSHLIPFSRNQMKDRVRRLTHDYICPYESMNSLVVSYCYLIVK